MGGKSCCPGLCPFRFRPVPSQSRLVSVTTYGHPVAELEHRRYHAFRYGRYPVPNDEEEYKRESLRHVMLKDLLGGKLYMAPIGTNPQKIIDLGTGFGEWAIEGTSALS